MDDERTRVRRRDREITDQAQIADFLHKAQVGFIATSVADQPFINSNLFWYDDAHRKIYFHTAREGRTQENVTTNPQVCFTIGELGSLLPAPTALEFSAEYQGVCVFGQAQIVEDQAEQRRGLQGLLDKYFPDLKPGEDYRPITEDELEQTCLFTIEIETWSGKMKVAGK